MYVEQILYHCVNGNRTSSTCILLFFFQFIIIINFFRFRISQYHINRNIYLKKQHTGLLNVNDILRSVANRSDMYIYFEN